MHPTLFPVNLAGFKNLLSESYKTVLSGQELVMHLQQSNTAPRQNTFFHSLNLILNFTDKV